MLDRISKNLYIWGMAKAKHPADLNKRAKSIVDIATGEIDQTPVEKDALSSAASLLGRKGGAKGGKARAESLSPKRRSEIAKKAAQQRWSKK